jgi:hypothetical protein
MSHASARKSMINGTGQFWQMFGNVTFFVTGASAIVSCLIFSADGATTVQANFGTAIWQQLSLGLQFNDRGYCSY